MCVFQRKGEKARFLRRGVFFKDGLILRGFDQFSWFTRKSDSVRQNSSIQKTSSLQNNKNSKFYSKDFPQFDFQEFFMLKSNCKGKVFPIFIFLSQTSFEQFLSRLLEKERMIQQNTGKNRETQNLLSFDLNSLFNKFVAKITTPRNLKFALRF